MNTVKRVFALIMVCFMVMTFMPYSAFADDHEHDWKSDGDVHWCTADGAAVEGCSEKADHIYDENHICTVCEYENPVSAHDFSNHDGVCTICFFECPHDNHGTDGKCPDCEMENVHHDWDDGVCAVCGLECDPHDWADGVCTKCGKECGHEEHGQDGVCTTCGKAVEHNWSNGACTVCEKICEHDWSDKNGVCKVCGYECEHTVHGQDGICTACGKAVEHNWSNGECTVCGLKCAHDWSDNNGKCKVCGSICLHEDHTQDGVCNTCGKTGVEHDWSKHDGTCAFCNVPCAEHDWSDKNGICKNCGTECEHDWSGKDGTCKVCGLECAHPKWTDSKCDTCGKECAHDWTNKDGKCKVCGKECAHDWSDKNGTCKTCGKTCEHPKWTDSKCDTCGKECAHDWSGKDGKCKVCGKECAHDWSGKNGVCKTCGKTCTHDWSGENDACKVCGLKCAHDWTNKDGKCKTCGKTCTHDWSNKDGVCKVCGLECSHDNKAKPSADKLSCTCQECGKHLDSHLYDDKTGSCKYCGHHAAAMVDDDYYATMDEAFAAFTGKDGSTLKLLDDFEKKVEDTKYQDYAVYLGNDGTIDLNGHTVKALVHFSGDMTLINSVDGGGLFQPEFADSILKSSLDSIPLADVKKDGKLTLGAGVKIEAPELIAVMVEDGGALVVNKVADDEKEPAVSGNTAVRMLSSSAENSIACGSFSGNLVNDKGIRFISGGTFSNNKTPKKTFNSYCVNPYGALESAAPYSVIRLYELTVDGKKLCLDLKLVKNAAVTDNTPTDVVNMTKAKFDFGSWGIDENDPAFKDMLSETLSGSSVEDRTTLILTVTPVINYIGKNMVQDKETDQFYNEYNYNVKLKLSVSGKVKDPFTGGVLKDANDPPIVYIPYGDFSPNAVEQNKTLLVEGTDWQDQEDGTISVHTHNMDLGDYVVRSERGLIEIVDIEGNVIGYPSTLKYACEVAEKNQYVRLLADYDSVEELPGTATIDLNGFTVKGISVKGDITITDRTDAGVGGSKAGKVNDITVLSTGKLTLKNGNAGNVTNYGSAYVNDGVINGKLNNAAGYFEINGGNVFGSVENSGALVINGGELETTSFVNTQNLTVNDGVILGTISNKRAVTVKGGEIYGGKAPAFENEGKLYLSGGLVDSDYDYAVNNVDGGNVYVTSPAVVISKDGSDDINSTNDTSIHISGGQFENPVPAAQCERNYVPSKKVDGDGFWYVEHKDWPVEVYNGSRYVSGFDNAVDALEICPDDGNYTLLLKKDFADKDIVLNKDVILNGNGHEVGSITVKSGANVTIHDISAGTITVKDKSEAVIKDTEADTLIVEQGSSADLIVEYATEVNEEKFNNIKKIINDGGVSINSGFYDTVEGKGSYVISAFPLRSVTPTARPYFKNAITDNQCYREKGLPTVTGSGVSYYPLRTDMKGYKYTVNINQPLIIATNPANRYIYYKNSTTFSPTTVTLTTNVPYASDDIVYSETVFDDYGPVPKCLKIGSITYDIFGNSGSSTNLRDDVLYEVGSDSNGNTIVRLTPEGVKKWFNTSSEKKFSVCFVSGETNQVSFRSGSAVKTGDPNNVKVWAGIAAGALVACGGAAWYILKKNRKK